MSETYDNKLANLLHDYVREATEGSLKRDFKTLTEKYKIIVLEHDPDPLATLVFDNKTLHAVSQVLVKRGEKVSDIHALHISQCPEPGDFKRFHIPMGKKSMERYVNVVSLAG